jgi:putative nucleotidyltransferase with HDIG domain
MQRIKLGTENLKAGMFIAQLDRPWLETPFLFQGFEVSEDSEIELLQQYCCNVYVDTSRSSLPAADIENLISSSGNEETPNVTPSDRKTASKPSIKHRFLALLILSRLDPTGWLARKLEGTKTYRIRTSLKKEMPQASNAYDTALHAVNDVLDRVREGRTVDIEQVRDAVNPMIESVLRNPGAMTWFVLLKKRDSYTYNHSIASSVWATVLGRHLGFDRPTIDALALGGMLLDIGKARLPEYLLQKEGKLDERETELFRKHVNVGLEMVKVNRDVPQEVIDMVANHHERHDGSGYPQALSAADIPVHGRIAGLIDCYDAMTSNRPYAKAMSSYEAIRELNSMADVHFQKELVEQFVQALGMFPTGSIVELNDGAVGIVIQQNRVRRLRPKIMLVLDSAKQPIKKHKTIDLRKVSGDSQAKGAKWIQSGLEPGAFGIDSAHYFIG